MRYLTPLWIAMTCCLLPLTGQAATFALPAPGNDLVGEVRTVRVAQGDTLLDIAREHGLGYNEIVAANPDIDPWLPPVGTEVTLPMRYILPSAPRRGIIVNLAEMRLYYYPPPREGEAAVVMTYPIGIGQEGWSTPLGITSVVEKIKDPAWTVPESIRAEYLREGVRLPKIVPPGPDNPLGRYALRLGQTRYLIHGTNKPYGVGRRVSHGCLRLYPEDIEALFNEVGVGTSVWIINQPYKLGREDGRLYLEAHPPVTEPGGPPADNITQVMAAIEAVIEPRLHGQARQAAARITARERGLPEFVSDFRPAAPSGGGGWMLQLGAFSDRRNAARLAAELAGHGATVSVMARVNDGYCHVLVGPYPGEDVATEALAEFERLTGQSGAVLPADRHGMLSDCLP